MKKILLYKLLWLNGLLIIFLIPFLNYYNFLIPVFYLLTTNYFDSYGYFFLVTNRNKAVFDIDLVKAYRIIQLMFNILLILLLGIKFSWLYAFAGGFLILFGLQDLLYYIFLQLKYPKEWTWLIFTPLGFIKKKLTQKEVVFQALAGIVLTVIILFLL